jgi:hypothetical protein
MRRSMMKDVMSYYLAIWHVYHMFHLGKDMHCWPVVTRCLSVALVRTQVHLIKMVTAWLKTEWMLTRPCLNQPWPTTVSTDTSLSHLGDLYTILYLTNPWSFRDQQKMQDPTFRLHQPHWQHHCLMIVKPVHSGYPKNLGRVFWVFRNSGLRITTRYLSWKEKTRCFGYPKFWVRV